MRRDQLLEIALSPDAARAGPELRPEQRQPHVEAKRQLGPALGELDLVLCGAGSVGGHLARFAAQSGVRSLTVADPGRLKSESLLTHGVGPEDVGRPKALVAAELAKALSPRTRVHAFWGEFEALPLHAVAGADYVLVASDNLLAEVQVAQKALWLGRRVIQAAVHGESLSVQVRAVFGGGDGGGPCLACLFGPGDRANLDRHTLFSCSGEDSGQARRGGTPTRSTPQLCAGAASFGFLELTRRAVGAEDADRSAMIDYCAFNHSIYSTPVERRPGCFLDHQRHHYPLPPDPELASKTPRALLEAAGLADADPRRVTLEAENFSYASLAHCQCPAHPAVGRFLPRTTTGAARAPVDGAEPAPAPMGAHCSRCGSVLRPHPMHTRDEIPVSLLLDRLDTSLAALGAAEATSVRLRSEAGSALFLKSFQEVSR